MDMGNLLAKEREVNDTDINVCPLVHMSLLGMTLCFSNFFFSFFFFLFFLAAPWHVELPWPGIEPVPQQ